MHTDELDVVYGLLGNALGRIGERDAALFLATLVLDLVTQQPDGTAVTQAIERAERLTRI